MIDITKAQANQTTRSGVDSDWTVTLDGEQLYALPAHFTVQETFMIRDIVEKMMKRAAEEMKQQEQQLCLVKLKRLTEHGDAKLNALAAENERLAKFVEQHINREVA
jgi:hypothetical protein